MAPSPSVDFEGRASWIVLPLKAAEDGVEAYQHSGTRHEVISPVTAFEPWKRAMSSMQGWGVAATGIGVLVAGLLLAPTLNPGASGFIGFALIVAVLGAAVAASLRAWNR